VGDTLRAERLLDQTERAKGISVVKLARAVCLAVLVEPGLLRRARIQLVPGADAGTESDLWFSPLVLTRNTAGIVLDPEVLTVLRQQLATDAHDLQPEGPVFADRARALIARLHTDHPSAIQLEEEVVWEAVRHGTAAQTRIDARLRTALKAMATDSDESRHMARWAAQAWWRLPETVTHTDAARLLAVGAALRLGTAASVAGFGDQEMPASLGWLTPAGSRSPVLLGVELAADGLRFVEPADDGLTIELPRTSPLVVEVGWHDGATSHSEVMTIGPGTNIVLSQVVGSVRLRTLAGDRYIIEPIVASWPSDAPELEWPLADRIEERGAFARLLREASPERVLLIRGASETGKSHMSMWMIRYATLLPGVLAGRFDFKGSTSIEIEAFAQRLGIEAPAGRTLNERLALIFTELRRQPQPTLLVFDTYEAATEEAKDWIESVLLPYVVPARWLRVVITGQSVPAPAGSTWEAVATSTLTLQLPNAEDWFAYARANHDDDVTLEFVTRAHQLSNGKPSVLASLLGPRADPPKP
jgi:hypothetical protein